MITYAKIRDSYVTPFFNKQKRKILKQKLEEVLPLAGEYELALEDKIRKDTSLRYHDRIKTQILNTEEKYKADLNAEGGNLAPERIKKVFRAPTTTAGHIT